MKYCPYCGTKMRDMMNFCPICGKKYKEAEPVEQPIEAEATSHPEIHLEPPPVSIPSIPSEEPVLSDESLISAEPSTPERPFDWDALLAAPESQAPREESVAFASSSCGPNDFTSGEYASATEEQSHSNPITSSQKRRKITPEIPSSVSKDGMRKTAMIMIAVAIMVLLVFGTFQLFDSLGGGVPRTVLQARESVVRIIVDYSSGITVCGSGFVVSNTAESTYIATNAHVVEKIPVAINVWLDGSEVAAEIFACETSKDLCILRCEYLQNISPLRLSKEDASQGDVVYAVGYPSAADYLSDTFAHSGNETTITNGIVSAVRSATLVNRGPTVSLLQINAAINSGNSGGPLFDKKGRVVGINTYNIMDSQGIFGAISAKELDKMMTQRKVPRSVDSNQELGAVLIGITSILCLMSGWILLRKCRNHKETISEAQEGSRMYETTQMSDQSQR